MIRELFRKCCILGVRLRLLRLAVEASPRVPHKRAALAKLAALAAEPAAPD
jgi:hypothetical protein